MWRAAVWFGPGEGALDPRRSPVTLYAVGTGVNTKRLYFRVRCAVKGCPLLHAYGCCVRRCPSWYHTPRGRICIVTYQCTTHTAQAHVCKRQARLLLVRVWAY